jgi:enoyl-[acyl-carrier protein] reductase I
MGLLNGKNAVVLGVADESSIAWAVAKAYRDQGARVHIGYQQKFFSRVRLLLRNETEITGQRLDVLNDDELAAFFGRFQNDPIDALVHAIAHGPPEVFQKPPSEVSWEGFAQAVQISCYSLARVVREAKPFLREWGSVMTFSFQAAERAEPGYGLMGVAKSALESLARYLAVELGSRKIRVNVISPGPLETVAALGIMAGLVDAPPDSILAPGYRSAIDRARRETGEAGGPAVIQKSWSNVMLDFRNACPLRQDVSAEDVAGCSVFLASEWARKITGQTVHVDAGLSGTLI